MYLSDAQAPIPAMNLVVKAPGEAASVAADVRAAVWSVDPRLAVSALTPMEEVVSRSVAQPRLRAMLLGVFGALSILLAAVGIHGVISWSVRRRTREIGVRMALGASRSSVLKMVAAQVGRLVAAGVAIGLLGALALTRLLSTFLYEIEPTDPATFAAVTLVLVAAAFAAAGIPARRAAAIDPAMALREE
jgi:putative ABC transport system permease protein